jgi:hypothetical protein
VGHSSQNRQNPWLYAITTLPLPDRQSLKQLPLSMKRSSGWFLCGLGGSTLLAWHQGFVTAGILAFLVWQELQRSPAPAPQITNPRPASFDDWLMALHSPRPLDRIQAIHQLHRQGERTTELLDYLRYLQDQDPDAQVRQVAFAIAQQLQPELSPSQQPLHQLSMEDLTLFATNLHAIER